MAAPNRELLAKLKEFKRVAMRACKLDTNFKAMIRLSATTINSR